MLKVKGYEVRQGFDLGVVDGFHTNLVGRTQASFAIVFEDQDGDGVMGEGECPLDSGKLDGVPVSRLVDTLNAGVERSWEPVEEIWVITTGGADGRCVPPTEVTEAGANVEPTVIGVHRATGNSIVAVEVFEDRDADGFRGAEEPLIPESEAWLRPAQDSCIFGNLNPESQERADGETSFSDVPAGRWTLGAFLHAGCGQGCEQLRVGIPTTPPNVTLHIEDESSEGVKFGFRFPAPSYLRIEVTQDLNGDGIAGPDESRVPGAAVCWETIKPDFDGLSGGAYWPSCAKTDEFGAIDAARALPGTVRISLDSYFDGESVWFAPGAFLDATLGEGETRAVTLLVRQRGSVGISGCTAISC